MPTPGKLLPGIRPAAAPLTLSWLAGTQAQVGEQFRVVVNAQTAAKVISVPIQVGFDPAVLEAVDVTEGSFLNQNNVQTAFDSSIDQAGGKISINMSQPGQIGNAGRGSLVTITFKAIAVSPQSQISVCPHRITSCC